MEGGDGFAPRVGLADLANPGLDDSTPLASSVFLRSPLQESIGLPVAGKYSLRFRRRSEAMAGQAPRYARNRGGEWLCAQGRPRRLGQLWAGGLDTFGVASMSQS